jgi:hypothetical protein
MLARVLVLVSSLIVVALAHGTNAHAGELVTGPITFNSGEVLRCAAVQLAAKPVDVTVTIVDNSGAEFATACPAVPKQGLCSGAVASGSNNSVAFCRVSPKKGTIRVTLANTFSGASSDGR